MFAVLIELDITDTHDMVVLIMTREKDVTDKEANKKIIVRQQLLLLFAICPSNIRTFL